MCSCIPVRVSEVNGKVDVSVLMITSRGGKGLVFPKVDIASKFHRDTPAFIQSLCVLLACTTLPETDGDMCREAGKLMRLLRQLLLVRL